MITTKQRAMLRGLANTLEPSFQIGKEGILENSIEAIDNLLEARELVKIKVLKTCEFSPKQVMEKLIETLKVEPVQVIGYILVVYRLSKKKNFKHIELI